MSFCTKMSANTRLSDVVPSLAITTTFLSVPPP
jgi:hypothetical protein